jgi:site-specific DNA recombinase
LREQYDTYKSRLDKLYEDKVDGVVSVEFFKRKSAEWDAEQTRILRAIDEHHAANHSYINEGVKLLELAKRAYSLYEKQKADEKRKLLNFVCSNSIWREGRLRVNFRQPFDVIAVTNATWINEKAAGADSGGLRSIWLRR